MLYTHSWLFWKSANTVDMIKLKAIEKIFGKNLFDVGNGVIAWYAEANYYRNPNYVLVNLGKEFTNLDVLIEDLYNSVISVSENWDHNHDVLPCKDLYPFEVPINKLLNILAEALKTYEKRFI